MKKHKRAAWTKYGAIYTECEADRVVAYEDAIAFAKRCLKEKQHYAEERFSAEEIEAKDDEIIEMALKEGE